MTWILPVLLWQLLQCYFGSMNWLWLIWRIRHVFPKHSDLVLLGNMGYRLITQLSCKQKSTVLSFCNQCWSGCFSCSSLEMFCARKVSDYLENTSYSSRGSICEPNCSVLLEWSLLVFLEAWEGTRSQSIQLNLVDGTLVLQLSSTKVICYLLWNEIHLAGICNDDERFWLCRDWSLWRNNKCISTSTSSPEGIINS